MPDQPDDIAGLERRPAGLGQELSGAGDIGRWPPFTAWLVALVGLGFVVNAVADRHLYADSFYDLYAGRYILRHGIPQRNVVTVAAHGAPWIDQQWLAQVIYYAAWAAGGYAALAVLSAMLVTSGFAVLALLMLRRGVPPTRMFAWTTAAVIACVGNTVIRAQSFAFPLFAVTLWLILADSGAPRLRARTWLVVPVLVIWANTHGSVLLGAGLVALYAGYRAATALLRRDRRPVPAYLALGAVAAASVVCTPYGIGVVRFYQRIDSVTPALTRYDTEWGRPTLPNPFSWAFFALTAGTAIAVAVAWRRGARPDPLLAAAALVLLGLALTAIRNQVWFAFGGSLLAADTLARSGRPVAVLSKAFGWATAGVFVTVALAGLADLATTSAHQFESKAPVQAINTAADLAARNPRCSAGSASMPGWNNIPWPRSTPSPSSSTSRAGPGSGSRTATTSSSSPAPCTPGWLPCWPGCPAGRSPTPAAMESSLTAGSGTEPGSVRERVAWPAARVPGHSSFGNRLVILVHYGLVKIVRTAPKMEDGP